jgi:hypothetical protein
VELLKSGLKWTFYAVGGYLALVYATNAGKLLTSTSQAYAGGVKVLQGRG